MFKRHAVAALVALAGLLPATAGADTTVIARHGAWQTFGGTSVAGEPVCGISTITQDERVVAIKHFAGTNYFAIQLSKPSWRLPKGTSGAVHMQIDRVEPWTTRGASGEGNNLQFNVVAEGNNVEMLLNELTFGATLRFSFPGGTEPDWHLSLSGSSKSIVALVGCMQRLTLPKANTQPFGNSRAPAGEPTQPFGGGDGGGQPVSGRPARRT